ncbi:MAG: hypothetical protein ABI361_12585 [Nitrososphaera sp.]|jgi:hypothetical protein
MGENDWSQWLDFTREQIGQVPELPGVFISHASMKILKIGGASNLRIELGRLLDDACCNKSKRFKYLLTESFESESERLVREYAEKHAGKLPECMQ